MVAILRKFRFFLTAAVVFAAAVLMFVRLAPAVVWKDGNYSMVWQLRFVFPDETKTVNGFDLNKDGRAERYVLERNEFSVLQDGVVLWQSPRNWSITDFGVGDVDGDGVRNIVLDVWKAGNYGSSHPFWEVQDMAVRNHVFVYDLIGKKMHAKWQSSNLTKPNCTLDVQDLNADGKAELIVGEGGYGDNEACAIRNMAVWQWHDWGFVNEWRGMGNI